MREPNEFRLQANGVGLTIFDWPGEEPAVLFIHATGFHARCWDQVIAHLPGRRCISVDMRGHGRSDKPEPPYSWDRYAADLAGAVRQLGLKGAIGVGHSMGGHSVTVAAAAVPGAFAGLVLVDPVIMERERYRPLPPGAEGHFASRRRNHWASPEAMYESFHARSPFNTWDPAVLHDYCQFGLLPSADGHGYVLACPPAVEAATYAGSMGTDPYGAVAVVDVPVYVLRARQRPGGAATDMTGSTAAPDLASKFARARDIPLPQHTHFIPMEAPQLVAAYVQEMLTQVAP